MNSWKFTDLTNLVAVRISSNGWQESILSAALPEGTLVLPYIQPKPDQTHPTITPVSPRQIRQALTRAGLRTVVESTIAAGDQDLKDWWEFSTSFERQNPLVIAMGELLGVSAQQLDDIWLLANTL